jgi:hypothetical protein
MIESGFEGIPCVTVHPSRVNLFSLHEGPRFTNPDKPRFNIKSVSNKHNDKVSENARRKISKAIEYLIFMANKKALPNTYHGKAFSFSIAFITLTLPSSQIHSDVQIKEQCLNQFIVELRQKWHVKNYVWRAEKQVNGNIHFHVLVDKFIPWNELRNVWNRITNKLGYVDRYRDEMLKFHSGGFQVRKDLLAKWDYKKQVKAYQAGKANDWNSPNSTDIHSIRKVSNIFQYIVKYATKDSQTAGLNGRLWGCNYELSEIKGGRLIADSHVKEEINKLCSKFPDNIYKGDHFTSIKIDFRVLMESDFQLLFKCFSDYLIDNFGFNYQLFTPI